MNIPRLLIVALVAAMFAPGCGLSEYENRLRQTNAWYEYQDLLNKNLEATPTAVDEFKLRVPLGFKLLAAPRPLIDETTKQPLIDEETELPIMSEDERQPPRIKVAGDATYPVPELPGLVAAWRLDMAMPGSQKAPVLLYLLSNQSRHLDAADGMAVDPTLLVQDAEAIIGEALGLTIPEGVQTQVAVNRRFNEPLPPQENYAVRKQYTAIEYAPEDQNLAWVRVRLYALERTKDPIESCVICIYPTDLLDLRQLEDRLKLALETFDAPSVRPPARKKPGAGGSSNVAPGATPASAAPSF